MSHLVWVFYTQSHILRIPKRSSLFTQVPELKKHFSFQATAFLSIY